MGCCNPRERTEEKIERQTDRDKEKGDGLKNERERMKQTKKSIAVVTQEEKENRPGDRQLDFDF